MTLQVTDADFYCNVFHCYCIDTARIVCEQGQRPPGTAAALCTAGWPSAANASSVMLSADVGS